MGIRFMRGVDLPSRDDLTGVYLEGKIILSYTLGQEGLPEARLFFQHYQRIPLFGGDSEISAMLGFESHDLNDVCDRLGQPSEEVLLQQFATPGSRRSIEHILDGPYLVRTMIYKGRGIAAATPYLAVPSTKKERETYAQLRDDLLSKIASVHGQVQSAALSSLAEIRRLAPTLSENYAAFVALIGAEKAAILQAAEKTMRIRSDFKRAYDQGFDCLQRYAPRQAELHLTIIRYWVDPLMTAINDGSRSLAESMFTTASLDISRLHAISTLAGQAQSLAKTIYQGVYGQDDTYQQYLRVLTGTIHYAQAFTQHAEAIQKGYSSIEKYKGRLKQARFLEARKERRKAEQFLTTCRSGIQINTRLLRGLNIDRNSWGLDRIKALLLMKTTELEHKLDALQRDYSLKR